MNKAKIKLVVVLVAIGAVLLFKHNMRLIVIEDIVKSQSMVCQQTSYKLIPKSKVEPYVLNKAQKTVTFVEGQDMHKYSYQEVGILVTLSEDDLDYINSRFILKYNRFCPEYDTTYLLKNITFLNDGRKVPFIDIGLLASDIQNYIGYSKSYFLEDYYIDK